MTNEELVKFRRKLLKIEGYYLHVNRDEYYQKRRDRRNDIISDFERTYRVRFSPDERATLINARTGLDILYERDI